MTLIALHARPIYASKHECSRLQQPHAPRDLDRTSTEPRSSPCGESISETAQDHVFIMIIVLDSAARVHRHPHVNGKYLISPNLIKFRRILVCDMIDCIFVGVAVPHTTLWLWFLLKQPLNSIDVYIVAMITTPALFQHIFKKKTRVEHQRTLYIRPPCTLLTRSICLITTSHRMEIFDASSNWGMPGAIPRPAAAYDDSPTDHGLARCTMCRSHQILNTAFGSCMHACLHRCARSAAWKAIPSKRLQFRHTQIHLCKTLHRRHLRVGVERTVRAQLFCKAFLEACN